MTSAFADEASRTGNDAALAEVLAGVFATRPAQHWEDAWWPPMSGASSRTANPGTVLQSAEFAGAADMLIEVEHPTFGEHVRLKPYIGLSPQRDRGRAGVVGGPAHRCDLRGSATPPRRSPT